jgi:hypothetical protein
VILVRWLTSEVENSKSYKIILDTKYTSSFSLHFFEIFLNYLTFSPRYIRESTPANIFVKSRFPCTITTKPQCTDSVSYAFQHSFQENLKGCTAFSL